MTTRMPGPSLSDRIVEDIRIGVLAPGTWLKQFELARQYDVSRPAVRRALDELAAKRIIQHEPNKGYRVCRHETESRREVREVRTLLETYAVDNIIAHATEADIAELRALAEAFQAATRDGTKHQQVKTNTTFHLRLIGICTNRCLVEQMIGLRERGLYAPLGPWQTTVQLMRAAKDHFDIVEALAARNAPRMKRLIARHINDNIPVEVS